ncbi:MAG: DUF5777 family beta-barrel protein [Melioribacteraceae bacterium]|nr:DUF5777 family beta-barrel protein [Melioribacteraceae bacterium]MCF8353002.1 DUF5777 family beta-barrel protein [Melioribacteraceae bacterium]MCF8392893.1 DUF5777 family beta-barrel protein [Melioribacteraceae bacterium]MCF8417813.1 DUF5777 family beta-barrel protein [Melioribacteraceae bacterium]
MKIFLTVNLFFFFFSTSIAQVKWQRDEPAKIDMHLFHSIQSINLPTAETLQKHDIQFEISHRFIPTLKSGSKDLWGFDGPVNIRLALGYAITDHALITLGRSNTDDNLDLWIKQRLFEIESDILPILISARAGAAWNSQPINRSSSDNRNFQYYAQLIINTMIDKKFGIGIVPSYLENAHIYCPDRQYSFSIGTNVQYYLSDMWSVLLEWNPTITGWRTRTNPVAFGVEIETGGHFFKIILSNSTQLNPSQFLAGAQDSFNDGEWHIGFNITRLLKFW